MKNSTELCENLSVTLNENTNNNSEIESTTIEEVKNISEEVSNKHSETIEMEVKTLDKNKAFKWTNEATKAAACMLKDITDEYNKANSDLSSSLDENTDPWGFYKLNEQMKVLKQSRELDLFSEEVCIFKLASVLKKYFNEHTKSLKNIKYYERVDEERSFAKEQNRYNIQESEFSKLYLILAQIGKYKIDFQKFVSFSLYWYNEEGYFSPLFNILCDNGEDYFKNEDFFNIEDSKWNIETFCAGKVLESVFFEYFISKENKDINIEEGYRLKYNGEREYFSPTQKEDIIKFNKFINIPPEFQSVYIEDLLREKIFTNLPTFNDIDSAYETNDLNKCKFIELMLILASSAFNSINYITLAYIMLTDQLKELKGLKETYSSMFED